MISKRSFDDDHEAFRDSVKRFVATEVAPNLDEWRRSGALSRSVVAAAGQAGFLGTAVPEEFGGGGTDDMRFLAVLIEETIAVGATGLALLWALHCGVTIPFLLEHGDDEAKGRWLPGLVSGELIGIPAPSTLSGVAGGALADMLLVDTGDDGVALVPVDHPGITITPIDENLAASDAALADIDLDGVAMDTLLPGSAALHRDLDLWFAELSVAGARTAVVWTLEYVRSRKVFGHILAEFENTRFRLAELSAELAMATAFVDSCILARNRGDLDAADAAAARLNTTMLHDHAVDQGLQLHGGYGYMREYPISQAFADARFLRLAGQAHSDARHVVAEALTL